MSLIYKKDWGETKKRFKDWWEMKSDEPLIQIFAPRNGSSVVRWDHTTFLSHLDNPEIGIRSFEHWCENTFFGGEAYPNLWVNMGPCAGAAYMGAKPQIKSGTVWYGAKSWDELQNATFAPDSEWWLHTKRITTKACETSTGKFIVGFTDIGAVTDIAVSLRGYKNLLLDFYRNQDSVRRLSAKILDVWFNIYEELYTIMKKYGQDGISTWMDLWCHKRWYPIHADFAYILSPSKFEELVLPYLKEYCLHLDYTIYHLDGIGQIPHLDQLLNIDELTGIQWVPGAGQPSLEDPKWLPIYRKVQKSGKNLVLLGLSAEGVKFLLKNLKPKGLVFRANIGSEMEAKQLLRIREKRTDLC